MTSVFARSGVALARMGVVLVSLGVGAFLVVRAEHDARTARARAAETPAPMNTSDVNPAAAGARAQLDPPNVVVERPPARIFLPSSKSLGKDVSLLLPPALVFPPGATPALADPSVPGASATAASATPHNLPELREPAEVLPADTFLFSSKSFFPAPDPAGAHDPAPRGANAGAETPEPTQLPPTPRPARRYLGSSKSSVPFVPSEPGPKGWEIEW